MPHSLPTSHGDASVVAASLALSLASAVLGERDARAQAWASGGVADGSTNRDVAAGPQRAVCEAPAPQHVRCLIRIATDPNGQVVPLDAPLGYGPGDLRSAYHLPDAGARGKVVAVVGAYDAPSAEADLAIYRDHYGLPPCTSATGCFRKVGQDGGASYPPADPRWATEIASDTQVVGGACPDCRILLVEANSTFDEDVADALKTAVAMGASAVSLSFGRPEDATVERLEPLYDYPGVLITVGAGDSGYGPLYPATSAHVLSVGGTTLVRSSSARGWAETAWDLTGGGCSDYIPKPGWQTDPACRTRMACDLAAVGDTNPGVAVYCSDCGTVAGWRVSGGTSVSSPIVAAAFTLLGVPADPSFVWAHKSAFYDVTSGNNGSCTTPYFCTSGPGYDGPSGWGTPDGARLGLSAELDAGDAAALAGWREHGCSMGGARMDAPGVWLGISAVVGSIRRGRRAIREGGRGRDIHYTRRVYRSISRCPKAARSWRTV
jgi:hypothetical protein